jgi:hypothetical protein
MNVLRTYAPLYSFLTIGLAVIGLVVWSYVCPCDRSPGFVLFGESVTEPVEDWSFANDVPLCQLQVWAGFRPHSVNLNCMATAEGELFLSCSVCSSKYWARQVGEPELGVLKLGDKTYRISLNREETSERLDKAWRARVFKLQTHGGGPYNPTPALDAERPGHWWSFHVTSRIAS